MTQTHNPVAVATRHLHNPMNPTEQEDAVAQVRSFS